MPTTSPTPPDQPGHSLIAAEVRQQTMAAIAESERRILLGIQKAVSEAVETKYKVVVGQLGEDKKKNEHAWQIALAVIPVLLTILLGTYLTWRVTKAQTGITAKIDEQKQELATRLALTQEYQKGKLNEYIRCTKTLNTLLAALETLNVDQSNRKPVADAVTELNDCTSNTSLYVTENVAQPLAEAQQDAIAIMQKPGNGPVDTSAFERARATAEKRMLDELTGVTVRLEPIR